VMNNQIIRVSSTKYLGITINLNLNWNKHCDIICSKANSTLGLLRRILGECSAAVKSRAYTSLVRPQLEYASTVWNPYTKRNIKRSRWFNAELLDLSSMTIPELATSLLWLTTWVGTISNNGDCYTKPLCSSRSIKALLESIFLMTCVFRLEHPGCLIAVLIAKYNRVSMYISYPRTIVTWNHIPFNNLCQSTLANTCHAFN
jgi:hypothetical protein